MLKKDGYVFVFIIVFHKLKALGRSFTYIKNNSGPTIDPCRTLHVTFGHLSYCHC